MKRKQKHTPREIAYFILLKIIELTIIPASAVILILIGDFAYSFSVDTIYLGVEKTILNSFFTGSLLILILSGILIIILCICYIFYLRFYNVVKELFYDWINWNWKLARKLSGDKK